METIIEWIVEEEDIDSMDHVNNCVYVSYLEKGRKHWYQEAGASKQDLEKKDLGTAVLKLDVLFRKEARLGERLWIKTCTARLGSTSFVLEQNIINEEGEIITEAMVTSVMFDRIERKSTIVAKEISRWFIE
ncbi:acyl-CoA thioesterase [Peribacillus sp. Hz7]|uniref:acyl-CoA thioesterase n=1 Tax=Peribacillus sp. Hz7 TaxID=3344873 RepID=UPI00304CC7A8